MHSAVNQGWEGLWKYYQVDILELKIKKKKKKLLYFYILRPNKHLHDVIKFCEVHFERLIWSYWLTAVRSESF